MFLKSYGDDSSDWKNQEILCVGSFLGWPKEFYYAGLEWEEQLRRNKIEYFRACECEGLFEQFSPARLGLDLSQARAKALSVRHDLIELLRGRRTGLGSISLAIDLKDFNELVASDPAAGAFYGTDPMRLAYKRIIRLTIDLLNQDWMDMPASVKICFTFDEHQKWREAQEEYQQIKESDAICAKRMSVVTHADDKEYPGLQMADLAAYEARLKVMQWLEQSPQDRPTFQHMARNHNIYYIGLLNRENMLKELESIK